MSPFLDKLSAFNHNSIFFYLFYISVYSLFPIYRRELVTDPIHERYESPNAQRRQKFLHTTNTTNRIMAQILAQLGYPGIKSVKTMAESICK
jgi:hypothetical protein